MAEIDYIDGIGFTSSDRDFSEPFERKEPRMVSVTGASNTLRARKSKHPNLQVRLVAEEGPGNRKDDVVGVDEAVAHLETAHAKYAGHKNNTGVHGKMRTHFSDDQTGISATTTSEYLEFFYDPTHFTEIYWDTTRAVPIEPQEDKFW